ncbi:MAG TPA: hypothetical protein PLO24_04395 [Bacteroidales bacterium]|jgi:hypothetical protein|nr:hypothetical protein [Bacteroidales bacterium]HOS71076.1 hypothetical protein [Bacteroidales bacterium]HQH25104.1 hypothetical protein [Bacteroidales bacterium]HQJ83581.1 hypothetical protein [Bacteroidales bacterium]
MRTLIRFAWIFAGTGVVCLILAAISLIFKTSIIEIDEINFFRAANSFFLLTIVLLIYADLKLRKRRITFN